MLQSVSRVMPSITTDEHQQAAARMRELLACYRRSRDLVTIGAYEPGTDALLDEALDRLPAIEAFLRQSPDDAGSLAETVEALRVAVHRAGA